MKRSLSLKKETLAELATDDLRGVVGGSAGPTCYTCVDCVVDRITEAIALPKVSSVNAPCQTG